MRGETTAPGAAAAPPRRSALRLYLWPLVAFVVLVALLAVGLRLDPREVPSPLIGKPAPAFKLATLAAPDKTLSPADLRGQVWLLNVWASWCTACREEHALLVDVVKDGAVPVYGLNYKDRRDDATAWLARLGNPYIASLTDTDGAVGIDWGVYGVPETFVVDRHGVIRHKQIGPLTAERWQRVILPLVQRLKAEDA